MNHILKFIDNLVVIKIIQRALIMLIPILMVGSFSLIVRSFPIDNYQVFIQTVAGGAIYDLFGTLFNATFNGLSIYTALCIGISVSKEYRLSSSDTFTFSVVALLSFLLAAGGGTNGFHADSLGGVGMFPAIACSLTSSYLYLFLIRHVKSRTLFSDGSSIDFNHSLAMIFPTIIISLLFAILNQICVHLFSVESLCHLFTTASARGFSSIGDSFLESILFIFLTNFFWFFGLHGSNMLETVSRNVFLVAHDENMKAIAAGLPPTEIYTKTFFDVFVYIGGCGTLLALVMAIFLFSKRPSNKLLSKIALTPMLFNINELLLFGFPIIFNPIMLIPFTITPLVSFSIAVFATKLGLVPIAINSVEWTTPILIGGYHATDSIAGAILQVVIVVVGALIYLPFLRFYEIKKQQEFFSSMTLLVDHLNQQEKSGKEARLTELNGALGDLSKLLVHDLKEAIRKNEITMHYQPQFHFHDGLVGAESLLRWNHPAFGFVPPNLIVQLAKETDMLISLERWIFNKVHQDMKCITQPFNIGINITADTVRDEQFVSYVLDQFAHLKKDNITISIEITEQSELLSDNTVLEILTRLKNHGFRLAIDDFSMGRTSLKYLSDHQFDVVKLDGSLVKMIDNPRNKDIISSIVYLSKSLGFAVLAEFVETQEERDTLAEIGCLKYQGYFYSKPLPLEDLLLFIEKNTQPNP